MGGNLFKLGCLPRRDYLIVESLIAKYLEDKVGSQNYIIPRYYDDKVDFGDLDVLINSSKIKDWEVLKSEIVLDLNIQVHKSVGNVFSSVYHNFQIDFFIKSDNNFLSAYNFLSFNDVGNIIELLKSYKKQYDNRDT